MQFEENCKKKYKDKSMWSSFLLPTNNFFNKKGGCARYAKMLSQYKTLKFLKINNTAQLQWFNIGIRYICIKMQFLSTLKHGLQNRTQFTFGKTFNYTKNIGLRFIVYQHICN